MVVPCSGTKNDRDAVCVADTSEPQQVATTQPYGKWRKLYKDTFFSQTKAPPQVCERFTCAEAYGQFPKYAAQQQPCADLDMESHLDPTTSSGRFSELEQDLLELKQVLHK